MSLILNPEEIHYYDTKMVYEPKDKWSMIPNEVFQIILQYVSINEIDKKFS